MHMQYIYFPTRLPRFLLEWNFLKFLLERNTDIFLNLKKKSKLQIFTLTTMTISSHQDNFEID